MYAPPLTSSRIAHQNVRDDLPFSVIHYLDEFRECVKARRYATMRLSDEALTIHDAQHGVLPQSAYGKGAGGTGAIVFRRK